MIVDLVKRIDFDADGMIDHLHKVFPYQSLDEVMALLDENDTAVMELFPKDYFIDGDSYYKIFDYIRDNF